MLGWHKYGHLIGHACVTGRMCKIECTIMGMDKKIQRPTRFLEGGGVRRPTSFLVIKTDKKVGN